MTGWAFLFAAGFFAIRPGGILRTEFDGWREDSRRDELINREWADLAGSSTVLGSSTALRQIVEFIDYECDYCRTLHDTLSVFLRRNPGVAVVIRHLPNPSGRARSAALAAICAARQGEFERMHSHLLLSTSWINSRDWAEVANEVGTLDADALVGCMDSNRAAEALAADSAWGARLSVRGTPAFLSARDGLHMGVVSSSALEEWLQP